MGRPRRRGHPRGEHLSPARRRAALLSGAALAAACGGGEGLRYNGAFVGGELGLGLDPDAASPTLAAAGRASTVLHLVDADLGWRAALGDQAADHQLELGARLHPLFLFLLGRSAWAEALGALYVRGAAGPRLGPAGLGLGASLGGGVDVPLASPDAGSAPWVGVFGGRRWRGGPEDEAPGDRFFELRLGWRVNGP